MGRILSCYGMCEIIDIKGRGGLRGGFGVERLVAELEGESRPKIPRRIRRVICSPEIVVNPETEKWVPALQARRGQLRKGESAALEKRGIGRSQIEGASTPSDSHAGCNLVEAVAGAGNLIPLGAEPLAATVDPVFAIPFPGQLEWQGKIQGTHRRIGVKHPIGRHLQP